MKLKWYGHAAFRLTSEETGLSVIVDPYTPDVVGYAPIAESADVVIISSDDDDAHCRADLIPGGPAVVNALDTALEGGETEVKGLRVRAIAAAEWEHHPRGVPGQNGIYRFEMDGLSIAHMGDVGNPLSPAQIDFLRDVDVLLALAGGYLTIELPDLDHVIRETQPKIVVPMHFRTLTYKPRNACWIESFLSYHDEESIDFAFAPETRITRDDLTEATRVRVLDYVRAGG
ncbi:MAG: MBL fold metallo-hydrolase [Pseudomonadota bacterium]